MTEIELETKVRAIISDGIIRSNNNFVLLENKDVFDIIVCRNNPDQKLFFLEIKHYTGTNGRIGFGDQDGNGFQPEILQKRPKYFEQNLVWVFGRDDDPNYYVLKNDECSKYYAGGSIGKKQNNFQFKLFDENRPFSEQEFIQYLENWLMK